MAYHKDLKDQEIHSPFTWIFLNESERLSESGFEESDEGKISWQKSDDTFWMLKDSTTSEWINLIGSNESQTSTNNQLVITSSGTLTSGGTVVLNQNGTVSSVGFKDESAIDGTFLAYDDNSIGWTSSAYDSNNNKTVISCISADSPQIGISIVGSVSGNSIYFGDPVTFNSSNTMTPITVYDSINNKIVIIYGDGGNSNYGTAIVGTVSGNSISFGAPVVFEESSFSYHGACYDPISGKIVVVYKDFSNSYYGTLKLGTVSGNSISFGNKFVFNEANSSYPSACYDSNSNKIVISYRDSGNSSKGTAIVGSISGDSISFGSPSVFNDNGTTYYISSAFDTNNNKVIVAYQDYNNSSFGTVSIGQVSGDSISFNSPVVFKSATTTYISAAFDTFHNKVVISYTYPSAYSYYVVGDNNSGNFTFNPEESFNDDQMSSYIWSCYDVLNKKIIISYKESINNYMSVSLLSTKTSNADNWLGISSDDYLDNEEAIIYKIGDVCTKIDSLSIGEKYYVNSDGSLINSPTDYGEIGLSLTENKLLITKIRP